MNVQKQFLSEISYCMVVYTAKNIGFLNHLRYNALNVWDKRLISLAQDCSNMALCANLKVKECNEEVFFCDSRLSREMKSKHRKGISLIDFRYGFF